MRRYLLKLAIGLVALIAMVGAAVYFSQRLFVSRPQSQDAHERWETRMRLISVHSTLASFNQTADRADRETIRQVRTLESLWNLIRKKAAAVRPAIPFPDNKEAYEEYLRDGWNEPYGFVLETTDNSTIIRITSKAADLFVETVFDDTRGSARCSWWH